MWKDKKFIVIVSLIAVLIAAVGTIGGLALAKQYNNDNGQLRAARTELMQQASNFLQNHQQNILQNGGQALDNYLDKLGKDGKITQQQADDFKAWLKDRPDIPAIFGNANQPGSDTFGWMRNMMGGFGFRFGQPNN